MTERRWRIVFLSTLALSVVILFAPGDEVPSTPESVDKVVHVLLFAALMGSGLRASLPVPLLLPTLVPYAAVSELIQGSPLLGRSASLADLLADVIGVAVGWAAARLVARR